MFAYCGNNPIINCDPHGCAYTDIYAVCFDRTDDYAPNIKFLMAFYGVGSPSDIPEMPEGAMIFVENITSLSIYNGIVIVEGRTIVLDAHKSCEYTFVGIGWGVSKSIPLDRTITQGYVYGVNNVEDYCGLFVGTSGNMLATAFGGAYASPEVYAEIISGMGYAPSIGVSVTYYLTGQSDWIYSPANMIVATSPYQLPIIPLDQKTSIMA